MPQAMVRGSGSNAGSVTGANPEWLNLLKRAPRSLLPVIAAHSGRRPGLHQISDHVQAASLLLARAGRLR